MTWWMWAAVLWPLVGAVAGGALGAAIGRNEARTAAVYPRRCGGTEWDDIRHE